ncbi:Failed axon connections-like 4 [Homarus americanus]|uniref:Failed axon connections-like 4 n=2 Tax=Homarus americanus TaxID=6706 RepID=A0A8J5JIJ4_HOMAM|nr:Failed axon connections-like 4 [Homarus americanus]
MAGVSETEASCGWVSVVMTVALLLGSVYVYRYVIKMNRRRRWRQAGKDVVVVHCPSPGLFTPCVSPFVMKFLTYLRLAQIPYQLDHEEPFGQRGLCPWMTVNGEGLADSQLMIEWLGQHFHKNFTKRLTETQQAVARAFTIMIDEHLCW